MFTYVAVDELASVDELFELPGLHDQRNGAVALHEYAPVVPPDRRGGRREVGSLREVAPDRIQVRAEVTQSQALSCSVTVSGSGTKRENSVKVKTPWSYDRDDARTHEVDGEAAVAVPAGGHAEEGAAVGRQHRGEESRQPAGVGVGVAEVEYRREVAWRIGTHHRGELQQRQH